VEVLPCKAAQLPGGITPHEVYIDAEPGSSRAGLRISRAGTGQ
jgi:hypothetical protein